MLNLKRILGPADLYFSLLFGVGKLARQMHREDLKMKMKFFTPTITEGGFWGAKTTWTSREKPLSNEELKKYFPESKE